MISATGLVAAFAVLALGVSVIDTSIAPPNAAGGTTLHVAPSGADYDSIAAAVEAATDGDTILLAPGTYAEAIVIDKDITLAGDGPVEDIVITHPAEPMVWQESGRLFGERHTILLSDSDARLSGFTFTGDDSATVLIDGGSPVLTGLVFSHQHVPFGSPGSTMSSTGNVISLAGGTTATITDNRFFETSGFGSFDASEPLIEGNTLEAGSHLWGHFGDGAIIRGNTIDGALTNGIALVAPTAMLIEDDVITGSAQNGIAGTLNPRDVAPTIRGNDIRGSGSAAIALGRGSAGELVDNTLVDNVAGIALTGSDALVSGNSITGGTNGIVALSAGAPTIADNLIEGSTTGLWIGRSVTATVDGNTICGVVTDIAVDDGGESVIGDNELCGG